MRELGRSVHTSDGFLLFPRTPVPEFGDCMVLQLIEQGETEQVNAALAADDEGLGF